MTEMHTAGIWDPILDNYPAIWRITINKSWRNVRRQCWIYNSIFIWEQKQMFLWITCSHRTVLGNDWRERNAVRRRRKTGRDGDDCMPDGNELLERSDGCSDDTIRYDTRCYFNVRSKADISQLNLPRLEMCVDRSWCDDDQRSRRHQKHYSRSTIATNKVGLIFGIFPTSEAHQGYRSQRGNKSQRWLEGRELLKCVHTHKQVRKATHGLDGQHQDVDRTPRGSVSQTDRGQR